MREKNSDKALFIKIGSLGQGLLSAFVVFILVSALFAYLPIKFKLPKDSYWSSMLYNLSSAFAASAILSLTIEFASLYQKSKDDDRRNEDDNQRKIEMYNKIESLNNEIQCKLQEQIEEGIKNIKSAVADNILREIIGDDSILKEVKTHIIKQNLIRKNFRNSINIEWNLDIGSYVEIKLISRYSIYNLTSQTITYNFKVIETKDLDLPRKISKGESIKYLPKINYVSYEVKKIIDQANEMICPERFEATVIENLLNQTDDYIKFETPIDIPANCYAIFEFSTQKLAKLDKEYPIVSIIPTTDMEIDLVSVFNINTHAISIHPDPEKFKLEVNQPLRKRWKAYGILPGQGLFLKIKKADTDLTVVQPSIQKVTEELLEKYKSSESTESGLQQK